ncbi:MAG: hypothetical protein QME35_02535 [Thermoanaerobacteraceae bacterium]|nr:hypothetical protein [Thermoanaerobacteraceae bacterium]
MKRFISRDKGSLKRWEAKLIGKDPKTGIPTLCIGDLCCGSVGFLIKMLQKIEHYLLNKLTGDKKQYEELFEQWK